MDAAALIREARRRAGLSQAQLARLAGTSQPTVSAYESGAKQPAVSTLFRLLAGADASLELRPAGPRTMLEYLATLAPVPPDHSEDLATMVARGTAHGDIWFSMREFLDLVNRVSATIGPAGVEVLLTREPVPSGDARWDAFAAALAEHVAGSHRFEPPQWSRRPSRFLPRWWFPHRRRAFDAIALRDSPAAFRRRGIFIAPSMLERC